MKLSRVLLALIASAVVGCQGDTPIAPAQPEPEFDLTIEGARLDNLISADVVTADGQFLIASEDENADLFWALRGGGGNFGVCTLLEDRLHPVKDVYWGPMFYEVEQTENILRFYREYMKDAPEAMGVFPAFQVAPPLPFIPEDRHGDIFTVLVACWTGPLEKGEAAFKPFHEVAEVKAEHVGPIPFPAINAAFDALFPKGLRQYWKGNYVKELTDEAIAAHVEHGPKAPTVSSTMHLYPIDGACHRVASDATAFGHRDANWSMVIVAGWDDPAADDAKNTLNKSVPGTLDLRGGSSRAERDDRGGGRWSR